ncbi:nucleotide sugar dehydrogenase [Haloglycomyces albus]|uniref:nucleotide sugar dehydrogenase n=1 Tax=Haloglycomyces albus TaxID=526067 RepID=UPI00046CAE59|nr:nucleotide sugar dehydrogenase [Haloglycomyces albus]
MSDSKNTTLDLVVIGLGYVGLPLAHAAGHSGLRVAGFDLDDDVTQGLNHGHSHIDDLSDGAVQSLRDHGFHATTDPGVIGRADTVIICVPTPLSETGGPDLTAVNGAADLLADHIRSGSLVILESTTYPGTTEEILLPRLEKSGLRAGHDFDLAFSPERVDPGNAVWGITNTPKVVGGINATSTGRAADFYRRFIDTVHGARSPKEAEMAKLLENTYRHVNIALVNEMAVFCHELGIDLWETIRLASTKPFGYQAFYPGPGVGGHCIPIDPNYLSYKVRTLGYPFRFVELAGEINNRMPEYVAQRAMEILNNDRKALSGSRVVLLGVTYKPDIADQRESPAVAVARKLIASGAEVAFHDPYVDDWDVGSGPVEKVAELNDARADLYVLLTHHREYVDSQLHDCRPLLDTRGVVNSQEGVSRL